MTQDEAVREILTRARTVAVVGMSQKTWRASHHIGKYLAGNGYRVLPVNPALKDVLGMRCYANLEEAQAASVAATGRGIDLVNVFRAPEHVPGIVEDVIRLKIPYLWLQDEVVHAVAVERARAAGVVCVEDDCIYRRHAEMDAAAGASSSAAGL